MQLARKKSVFLLLLGKVAGKMAGEIIDMKIEPKQRLLRASELDVMRKGYKD